MTFRLFTNDVGPDAYSCASLVKAPTAADALAKFKARAFHGEKILAIRNDEESLFRYGPDGKTGLLPPDEILERGRKVGSVAGPWGPK